MAVSLRTLRRRSEHVPVIANRMMTRVHAPLTAFALLNRAVHLRPARNKQLDRRGLYDFAALVAGFAPHRDRSAVRPRARRHDFHDLAFDVEHIPGPRCRRPGDFSPEANDAASDREAAVDLKAHGDCRSVPSARRESMEQGCLRGLVIGVKRLRVEFSGECRDLFLVERMGAAREAPSEVKFVQIETLARALHRRVCHVVSRSTDDHAGNARRYRAVMRPARVARRTVPPFYLRSLWLPFACSCGTPSGIGLALSCPPGDLSWSLCFASACETTSRRRASTTASGCVIGIMCAAPGATTVVARSAAPSRRAAARGARSVFSPTKMVVGGGDSANHASVAVSDRVAVISNRSFGTSDVTFARPRLPIASHAPAPLQ